MPDSQFKDLAEASEESSQPLPDFVLLSAFDAFPDAAYLFGEDRRVSRANRAATKFENGESPVGKTCCQMFWHVEGAEGCVVDRALNSGEKVAVEVLSGANGNRPISIIVEPLTTENGERAAFVIARDISDLRRAEAEALSHKSFLASVADRTPDEIYALDVTGRITWMNERAEAYKLQMSPAINYLDLHLGRFQETRAGKSDPHTPGQ